MKLWVLLTLFLLWEEVQNGLGQQVKRRKEAGENRIRPGNKRGKVRFPKAKEKEAVGKGQSLLTQVLDKGRFLRLGEALTLPAGRSMELRCKGSRIEWNYPAYLHTYKDTRLSVTQQDKYGQLVLTSPSAADTGEYSCWAVLCDGVECEKDTERNSASYIYFTDKDELFVPSPIHFEIIYLRPDRTATIPCRVTSPQVKVTLHREVPPEEVSTNGTQISYDPTKGFVIREPSPEHRGIFYCRAVINDKPQISNKYQLLYVEVPSGPPSATIKASSSVVRGGDNFNITCTVLGEPEQHVNFTWTYPGQDMRPVSLYEAWRLINRGVGHTTRISQSVLTVEDAETIDYGKYICRTKNKHGETAVTTSVDSF
ncbi:LOW QUALITY PROTEIN: platelet-derived growth factor receptor-like protein [Anguilla anguilla]|uniref:LOW QUALITY PROTEIN: platelet-derived growth factor receptor-like protein n=1 Tax=Anguilla anguilla TaxID=7936 RepID=UPI0015B2621A|nr:LOW QUALITY PROTEIN: platelet-derived growth factor receptor-like protein [Anguilla anguilla]